MEEKISKSTDYELDSITNSNSSPPNEITISNSDSNNEAIVSESNPDPSNSYSLDSSKKKKHTSFQSHWQRLCASLLLAVFFITTSIGLIYAASTVGGGSDPGNPHYSAGGDPGWAIENIVAYMITPMQLFPYEPVFTDAKSDGKNSANTTVGGSTVLIHGGKVGNKKLSEGSYYGNTIVGADKGSIIFIPNYESSFASSHSDWARDKFASYRYINGKLSKSGSPFVVVFDSDDSKGTVDIGTKDPKVKNDNDGTEHIFTSELYKATGNTYDLTKLRDLKKAKLKSIANKSNAKKQSTQLWAYISTPEGSDHTPQVRDRINAYMSPMNQSNWLLQANGDEGDESTLTLQSLRKKHSKMYAITCYHVVDLILSLYSISEEEIWLNIADKYVQGWDTPDDGDAASVYDTLAITPAITAAKNNGNRFVIGLGDYIDYSLQNKDTTLVSKPETANF